MRREDTIQFNPLPVMSSSVIDARGTLDFSRAQGNLSDAVLCYSQLKQLIRSAVFLDEGAYDEARGEAAWEARVQTLVTRISAFDAEKASMQQEVAHKDEEILRLQEQVKSPREELDNNAQVFKLHHEELILRNNEIERLNIQLSLHQRD